MIEQLYLCSNRIFQQLSRFVRGRAVGQQVVLIVDERLVLCRFVVNAAGGADFLVAVVVKRHQMKNLTGDALSSNPVRRLAIEDGFHIRLQHFLGNVGFAQPQLRAVGLIAHRHALDVVEPLDGIEKLRRVLVGIVGDGGVNHHVVFRRLRVAAGVGKGVADKRKDGDKQRHTRDNRHHRRAVFFAAAL